MAGKHLPMVSEAFVNADLCKPCGGQCCQDYPGAAFPEDFGPSDKLEENLLEAFMTGRSVVKQGDDGLYVHPTFKGRESAADFLWWEAPIRSCCTFWSKEGGCEIFDKRPRGCRGLEPLPDMDCKVRYGSERSAKNAWESYQSVLMYLVRELARL